MTGYRERVVVVENQHLNITIQHYMYEPYGKIIASILSSHNLTSLCRHVYIHILSCIYNCDCLSFEPERERHT